MPSKEGKRTDHSTHGRRNANANANVTRWPRPLSGPYAFPFRSHPLITQTQTQIDQVLQPFPLAGKGKSLPLTLIIRFLQVGIPIIIISSVSSVHGHGGYPIRVAIIVHHLLPQPPVLTPRARAPPLPERERLRPTSQGQGQGQEPERVEGLGI
jgi:hypothetical protein